MRPTSKLICYGIPLHLWFDSPVWLSGKSIKLHRKLTLWFIVSYLLSTICFATRPQASNALRGSNWYAKAFYPMEWMAWHISFNPMFGIVARAWDYRKWEELFWTMGCCLCGWVSSPSPSPPISPCSPSGSNISDSESRIHSFNARIVSILDGCRNLIKMSGGKKRKKERERK